MCDIEAFVLAIVAMLISVGLLLGWINYKINKLKDELNDIYVGKENAAAAIMVLEGTIKKLNSVYRDLERRIDILESGHPDSDFDLAETDDDGNALVIWFNGKKYVPEDKRDEDSMTVYADGRIVAETTKPEEKRCCATCKYYRPESGYSTCDLRTCLQVTKQYATIADSACNNYEATPTDDEVEYICFNRIYRDIGGNAKAKCLDELQKLNVLAHLGGCSVQEWRQRWEELMQNDS